MQRASIAVPLVCIPLVAVLMIYALVASPLGPLFATMKGVTAPVPGARIHLSGMHEPKVDLVVAKHRHGSYVRMTLNENQGDAEAVVLMVPHDWHFQEVSGVHVREVVRRNAVDAMQAFLIRNPESDLTLVFDAKNLFDSVVLSHDGIAPALARVTFVQHPWFTVRRVVETVDQTRTFNLF